MCVLQYNDNQLFCTVYTTALTHTHTYTHKHKHTQAYKHNHTHTDTHTHTHTQTHTHTNIHTHTHTDTHTHTPAHYWRRYLAAKPDAPTTRCSMYLLVQVIVSAAPQSTALPPPTEGTCSISTDSSRHQQHPRTFSPVRNRFTN